MDILDELFKTKQDPLEKRAETLIGTAKSHASRMYLHFLNRYPFLRKVSHKNFDFFVTVAEVYAASAIMSVEVENRRAYRLLMAIVESFSIHYPDQSHAFANAFEDCRNFFVSATTGIRKSGPEKQIRSSCNITEPSDVIGAWVVQNLFDRTPRNQQEWELASSLGLMISQHAAGWWDN